MMKVVNKEANMKRLLLLLLAAIPLFAFSGTFIYYDYGYSDTDCWYDEYWVDDCWYDGYWVYYPHGYYCVHYVWWYPWWWDWYWVRCHWCHHFYWDFFYAGFYVVWYQDGCWWFRPRYGHWVAYQLPHSYYTIHYNAGMNGIYLPDKPPREIVIPYNDSQVMNLSKQHDPELFTTVEKNHKSGNLEKMRQAYDIQLKQEIAAKNEEYRAKNNSQTKTSPTSKSTSPQKYTNKNAPTNRTTSTDSKTYGSGTKTYTPKKEVQKNENKSYSGEKSTGNTRIEPSDKRKQTNYNTNKSMNPENSRNKTDESSYSSPKTPEYVSKKNVNTKNTQRKNVYSPTKKR